jgi:hypothetical protein
MAKTQITRGTAAGPLLIDHFLVQDSTTGAGKTGLTYSSFSGWHLRNGETKVAITAETIATLGSYVSPTTAASIGIKEVANGIYEYHLHPSWVNATNSCHTLTIVLVASGSVIAPIQIELVATNNQDGTTGGLAALPSAAAGTTGGLAIRDEVPLKAEMLDSDGLTTTINDAVFTGSGMKLSTDGTGSANVSATSVAEIAAAVPAEVPTAADIATAVTTAILGMTGQVVKNQAFANFPFVIVASADHATPLTTSVAVTATRIIDGGVETACAGQPTFVAKGLYRINLTAADTNGDKITYIFTPASGGDVRQVSIFTRALA